MNPVTGAVLTTSALWLIILGLAVSEVRKKLRDRRLDQEARERRDRQIAEDEADEAQWGMGGVVNPEFDPCGASAIVMRKIGGEGR